MKKLLIPIALFISWSAFSQITTMTPITGGPFTTFTGTIAINVATASQSGYVSTIAQSFAGDKTFTGDVIGLNFKNITSANNATLALTTNGTVLSRNVADGNTAFRVNQGNSSSTGSIFETQFAGTTVFQVNYTGSTVVNSIGGTAHAMKVGQNNGVGDILVLASNYTDMVVFDYDGEMNKYSGDPAADGEIPIGSTSSGAWTMETITPAGGTQITNGSNSITISSGYTLQGFMSKFAPTASAKYGGGCPGVGASMTAGSFKVYIPVSGTLDKIYLFGLVGSGGDPGDVGQFYVTIDDVTDITISTSVPLDNTTFDANVTNVNTAVTAGHFFEIKVIAQSTPYGANPPGDINCNVVLWIK